MESLLDVIGEAATKSPATAYQIAKQARVKWDVVQALKKGKRPDITCSTASRLMDVLGLTVVRKT